MDGKACAISFTHTGTRWATRSRYEYAIAQMLTIGPTMGRDVAFSPNGDHIALFVKKERGRNLLIINALSGAIERSVPMKQEQELSPAYSPDGKKIAFA